MNEFEIKDVPILRIGFFNTKKDGSPLVTKDGKPFKKVLIDVSPDIVDDPTFTGKLSMLDFDGVTDNWKEGTLITGKVVHDGDYWNFVLPKDNLKDTVEKLVKDVEKLKEEVSELRKSYLSTEDEITDDDLPF